MATAFKKMLAKKHSDSSDNDSSVGKPDDNDKSDSESVEDIPQATSNVLESVSSLSPSHLHRHSEHSRTPSPTRRSGRIVKEHLSFARVALLEECAISCATSWT
jgi:hypothetical protein